jgi:hypothetical protein
MKEEVMLLPIRIANRFCANLAWIILTLAATGHAQSPSQWSAAGNLGPVVNSPSTDGCPFIAKNELTLYLASNRPGGFGGLDLYVSQRFSVHDPWSEPQNLGPGINTSANELCPTLSNDGHQLFFVTDRAGGCGAQDLHVARRQTTFDDFGWGPPANLGCDVNSPSNDFSPSLFGGGGAGPIALYFSSNRPGGPGGIDIYASTFANGAFGPPSLVSELNTASDDQRPNVRHDGLEIFFESNRPGSIDGSPDLWAATRTDASRPWSQPVNLGSAVNTAAAEVRPSISFDGRTLYLGSAMPGGSGGVDLYVSRRTGLPDAPVATGLTLDTTSVRAGGSFKATFAGTNLGVAPHFDVRFRAPGAASDEVAWNWQSGPAGLHAVPATTLLGEWNITGIRAHQDAADHSGAFTPVTVSIVVADR